MSGLIEKYILVAVGIAVLAISIPAGTWMMRMLEEPAAKVCHAEAMNPSATLIVKVQDASDDCSMLDLAREARSAVRTVLEEESENR